jgi:hypothetical protein
VAVVVLENVPAGTNGLDIIAPDPGSLPQDGAIATLVRSAATGLPVEVSTVAIAHEGKEPEEERAQPKGNGGSLRIGGLIAGNEYTIVVAAKGYASIAVHGLEASAEPVPVTIDVPATGSIDVEVVDGRGVAISYVEVRATRTFDATNFHHSQPARTDSRGRAHFATIDPGEFRVTCQVGKAITEDVVEVGGGDTAFVRLVAGG